MSRFVLLPKPPAGYESTSEGTRWWKDTKRDIDVQVYADKDPNDFRPVEGMELLFTDQAEYYVVCPMCYAAFRGMQWSGSTRGGPNWRQRAEKERAKHERDKGWCEFCDPVFGNGGWR